MSSPSTFQETSDSLFSSSVASVVLPASAGLDEHPGSSVVRSILKTFVNTYVDVNYDVNHELLDAKTRNMDST